METNREKTQEILRLSKRELKRELEREIKREHERA